MAMADYGYLQSVLRGVVLGGRADAGVVALTTAHLALLLEWCDWRQLLDAARPRGAL